MLDKPEFPIDIGQIMNSIPHRYPFLLVDRIIEAEPSKSIKAIKNVTINEPYFIGHFPGYPIVPGVLIVESLAQVAGMLTVLSFGARDQNDVYLLAGIDKVRFKQKVVPGDVLVLEVMMMKYMRGLGKYNAKASVNGKTVVTAELLIAKKEI